MDALAKLVVILHFAFATLTNRGIFTEGLLGQPTNLVPYVERQNQVDRDLSFLLYPQLVAYNLRGDLVPSLAESWQVSADHLRYHFKLRDDLSWSNGRKITSDDVLFTAKNAPEISNVEINKINGREVEFSLKEPFAPFLDTLARVKIIPPEAKGGLKPVTLADRQILRVVKSGQRVDEILLSLHSGNAVAPFHFLRFRFYDQQKDLETASLLREVDAFRSERSPGEGFFALDLPLKARRYGLFFNLKKEKLQDVELRRSLAEALDKNRVVRQALGGLAEPLNLLQLEYRPELTADYQLEVTLTVPNEDRHLRIADLIREDWERLGVSTKILPLPFWDISTRVIDTKDFEILLFGQEKGRDPDEYTLWHSSKTQYPGLNISQLNNQRVDDALEKGRKEMDEDKRAEHYKNFWTVLREEAPAVFLYRPLYRWQINKKYQSVFEEHLLVATCCDGCQCDQPRPPEIYYPWERFGLLPQ